MPFCEGDISFEGWFSSLGILIRLRYVSWTSIERRFIVLSLTRLRLWGQYILRTGTRSSLQTTSYWRLLLILPPWEGWLSLLSFLFQRIFGGALLLLKSKSELGATLFRYNWCHLASWMTTLFFRRTGSAWLQLILGGRSKVLLQEVIGLSWSLHIY